MNCAGLIAKPPDGGRTRDNNCNRRLTTDNCIKSDLRVTTTLGVSVSVSQ